MMILLQIFTMIDCHDLNNAFFHFSLANDELTLATVNGCYSVSLENVYK